MQPPSSNPDVQVLLNWDPTSTCYFCNKVLKSSRGLRTHLSNNPHHEQPHIRARDTRSQYLAEIANGSIVPSPPPASPISVAPPEDDETSVGSEDTFESCSEFEISGGEVRAPVQYSFYTEALDGKPDTLVFFEQERAGFEEEEELEEHSVVHVQRAKPRNVPAEQLQNLTDQPAPAVDMEAQPISTQPPTAVAGTITGLGLPSTGQPIAQSQDPVSPPETGDTTPPGDEDEPQLAHPPLTPPLTDSSGRQTGGYKTEEINWDLFAQFSEKVDNGFLYARPTEQELSFIKLLEILKKLPVGLFDDIVDWALLAKACGALDDKPPKREHLIPKAARYVGMENLVPKTTKITLPNAMTEVSVTSFDATEAILSLLLDKHLMREENIEFFYHKDIFASPSGDGVPTLSDHVYGDIYTAETARRQYHHCVLKRNWGKGETVIPLIFFIDKTHCDHHGRLAQEPVMFTLGCFNLKTRSDPLAWRCLGYIPNSDMHVTASTPRGKCDDYHVILHHILGSLGDFQKKPSYWAFPDDFTNSNKPKDGIFHFPFGILQGDMVGHNTLCGHFQFSSMTKMGCRLCNTPREELCNPRYKFRLLTPADITNYGKTATSGRLKCNDFGYHKLQHGNAFRAIRYGVSPRPHISSRCVFDIAHTDRKGNILKAIDNFRALRAEWSPQDDDDDPNTADPRPPKKKRRKERTVQEMADGAKEGANATAPEDDKKKRGPNHVFSPAAQAVAEKAMMIWGVLLQQQSDRSLYRTHFPQGPLSTAKLNCHEYPGIILLYLLFLSSTLGEQFLGGKRDKTGKVQNRADSFSTKALIGDVRVMMWVICFQDLLLNDQFMRSRTMSKSTLDTYANYLPIRLDHFLSTIHTEEEEVSVRLKQHAPVHIVEQIKKHGVGSVTDTEVGENHHIPVVKEPGKKTQKRAQVFDEQAANQHRASVVTATCSRLLFPPTEKPQHDPDEWLFTGISDNCYHTEWGFVSPPKGVPECQFYKDAAYNNNQPTQVPQRPRQRKWRDDQGTNKMQTQVTTFLEESVMPYCSPASGYFEMYNQVKRGNDIYRAHPHSWGKRQHFAGWMDWAYVEWNCPLVKQEMKGKQKRTKGGRKKATKQYHEHVEGEEYIQKQGGRAPAQLICFLNITGIKPGGIKTSNGRTFTEDGVYAVCHAVTQTPPSQIFEGETPLISRATKDMVSDAFHSKDNNIVVYLVPVDDIMAPCICVPDIIGPKEKNKQDLSVKDAIPDRVEYLLVLPPSDWPQTFLDLMNRKLSEE